MELTPEMILLLFILGSTIIGFVFEIFRVDVVAILAMIALGVFGIIGGKELFSGFAQNAVISIIAVMIIGSGLDKVGVIQRLAKGIMKIGGSSKKRIIPLVSSTVGIISSFMQNIGAAALFLPVLSKISDKTKIPMSQLLMPMGFCAIIGGTITMVGSSPLILLNSLIAAKNDASGTNIPEFGIFDVSPVGLALMVIGIAYFMILGKYILPSSSEENKKESSNPFQYFSQHFGLKGRILELEITKDSALLDKTIADIYLMDNSPHIIAMHDSKTFLRFLPSLTKKISYGASFAVMGEIKKVREFAEENNLILHETLRVFRGSFDSNISGIAEFILPHTSMYVGKTMKEMYFPNNTNLSILSVFRDGKALNKAEGFGKTIFKAGDTLLVHGKWEKISAMKNNPNIIIASHCKEPEELKTEKTFPALFFFSISLFLILMGGNHIPFTDIFIPKYPLALSLLIGAMGMILTGVLNINQAYKAVDWKTIFLLASLYPMGMAMSKTGTAGWIADNLQLIIGDLDIIIVQFGLAILTALFSLVMSNVGATVLLVPLAMDMAIKTGGNPAAFALIVAVSASNSFIIPTHQVNALIMGPGGYKVKDFMKAGSIMSLIFLIVSVLIINMLF